MAAERDDNSPGLNSESTFSRTRLEINCAEMLIDIRLQMLTPAALGVFWRLLPYAAHGGVPADFRMMSRFAHVSASALQKLWPQIEPFFERVDDDWALRPNEWAFPFLVARRAERVSLRHLFQRLRDFWGHACVYCGDRMERLAIEHIVPVARGGSNDLTNLTLACRRCNSRKGTRTAAEFGHPHIHDHATRIQ